MLATTPYIVDQTIDDLPDDAKSSLLRITVPDGDRFATKTALCSLQQLRLPSNQKASPHCGELAERSCDLKKHVHRRAAIAAVVEMLIREIEKEESN
jgi:hypothetical protein